jgi:hypothetical protein
MSGLESSPGPESEIDIHQRFQLQDDGSYIRQMADGTEIPYTRDELAAHFIEVQAEPSDEPGFTPPHFAQAPEGGFTLTRPDQVTLHYTRDEVIAFFLGVLDGQFSLEAFDTEKSASKPHSQ